MRRLVHRDPKLNQKGLWYRVIADLPGVEYYLVVIHGVEGQVSSTVHAVHKSDYDMVQEPTKKQMVDAGEDLI